MEPFLMPEESLPPQIPESPPAFQNPQFNILIPEPFSLANHSETDKKKIIDEIMDKRQSWESGMSRFFTVWNEVSNYYRLIPKVSQYKPKGLYNSVSGETNRAVNTLSSLWFRMLTASDPYFEVYAQGLDWMGQPISDEQLYGAREVLMEQFRAFSFKSKLKRALTSIATFGTVIVEEPWIRLPYGNGQKYIEGTDFQIRSLLQTGFDPYVMDIDFSDYIFTADYGTKYMLRNMAYRNEDIWDKQLIEQIIAERSSVTNAMSKFTGTTYDRIRERKQRAGYVDVANDLFEIFNYHGKLDTENPILLDYWEKEGRKDDIKFTDWTTGIIDGEHLVRLHSTPYGSWKFIFKTGHFQQFELEPIAYGVGTTGKKIQRELNSIMSRSQDALTMGVYMMHLVGKFAGLKSSQLNIKPFNVIELDDIDQMKQMKIDMQAITQALAMQGLLKEDFRAITGATTNLQAVATGATATEASLTQAEGIRGNSVIAELIAETLMRGHISQCHMNNLDLLDEEIAVRITGSFGIQYGKYNRNNLPPNVGFRVAVTTDKDYTPDKIKALLEGINLFSSVRQNMPPSLNPIPPMAKEAFRLLGLDPALLLQQKTVADQAAERLALIGKTNTQGQIMNEVEGEISGAGGPNNAISTPMGPVPTSPNGSSLLSGL